MRMDIHSADVPVLCRACEARHRGICGALDAQELLKLGRTSSRHEYDAGTTLVAAGEYAGHCSNILSGVVKLSKLLPDGRQQVVELQFAPDFLGRPFGEESDVLVEAATDVRLCSFPRDTLEKMMAGSPALENRMHRQALRQLDEARDWMMTLGRKSAAEKVASFLLMLSRHMRPHVKGCSTAFDLPLGRSDIADFLGLTVETVSRQLTKLRKDGIIEIEKARHVDVKDLDGLIVAAAN
ncbi:Crp/Fnr family transcriptional regulator [Paracoccus sediminicola]|uniref:Crp/Fnr family transcriptional regulator n=1 Tax=Paracoccus sediminicola TaxID=3017783 RepID=UPI0022F03A88|nr:Crp/Fnr family transcriptional regulator [Paracoccus sediminicola]WBU58748.1 Crp/Fnr family transcriptional regulator [Paracoccus sediminicola]